MKKYNGENDMLQNKNEKLEGGGFECKTFSMLFISRP